MARSSALLCALAVALLNTQRVAAHGILTGPAPRNGANIAGNNKGNANTGPCGNGNQQTKGAVAQTYAAGETVTIEWDIAIAHGGNCVISLATKTVDEGTNDDGEYNVGGDGILTDGNGQYTLAEAFPCGGGGDDSREITIPADAACENCVLQWFWDGDQNYYDCSDISITANAVGDEDGGGTGANLASAALGEGRGDQDAAVLAGVAAIAGFLCFCIGRSSSNCGGSNDVDSDSDSSDSSDSDDVEMTRRKKKSTKKKPARKKKRSNGSSRQA